MITHSFLIKLRYKNRLDYNGRRFYSFRRSQLTLNSNPGHLRFSAVALLGANQLIVVPGITLNYVFVAVMAIFTVTFYSFLYQQLRPVRSLSIEKCGKSILSV